MALDLQALQSNYTPFDIATAPKAKQNKRKSWISALPSVLAAGASFVPGVGTAGAAALGGLGELGRQALSGEGFNLGNVGKEAALSAVPGGLGKIGSKVVRGVRGGTSAAKTAKAAEATQEAAQAAKTAKGIPVKYIPSESRGTGITQTANRTMTNPSVGNIEDASQELLKKGYSVSTKIGKTSGRKSFAGSGKSAFEPASSEPVIGVRGKRTAAPITKTEEGVATTLQPKPQAVAIPATQPVQKTGLLSRVKSRMTSSPSEETALSAIGGRIRGSGRNITAGEKIPGTQDVLDQQTADRLNKTVSQYNKGVTARTPRGQLRGVQDAKKAKGAELDKLTTRFDNKLDDNAYTTLGKSVDAERGKIVGFDANKKAHIDLNNSYAQRVGGAKSIKELEEQRKYFDKEAKRILSNPDTKGSLQAQLAKAYRDAIDDYVAKVNPALKTAKGEYRDLSMAEDFLSKPGTLKAQQNIGVGRLPVTPVKAAQEATGKALQAIGSQKAPVRFARGLTGQVATRAVAAPFTQPAETAQEGAGAPLEGELVSPGAITPEAPQTDAGTSGGDQMQSALQAAMLQALAKGDYQGISAIKSVMDVFASQSKAEKPLSAEASKTIATANSGLDSLDQLEKIIGEGGVPGGTIVPGRGLVGGLGAKVLGTSSFDAAADNIADAIIRMRTGAAATKDEMKTFRSQLPQANDLPEVQQQKLATARDYLNSIANRTGSSGSDIQQLLAQGAQ